MRPRRRETYGRSQPKSTRMPSVDGQVVLPGRASQGSSEVAKAHAERRVGLYVLASALLVGGAAIVALAGPTIYFAPRAMSETASALAVVLGFALSLPRDAGSVRRVVGVSMLGVSVLMRLQNGIFCLGLLAILAGRRDIRGA